MYLDESLDGINVHSEEFLKAIPINIVNIVIFTIYNDRLCLVLVPDNTTTKRYLVLPGGIVKNGKTLKSNLKEAVYEKIGLKLPYLEQLYTFSNHGKTESDVDIICTTYFTLINSQLLFNEIDLVKINIVEYDKIESVNLGSDYKNIIRFAKNKLNFRLEYTTIGKYMLPQKFSIPQMQNDYEIMFGEEFDKRNFRKKVEQLNIVKFTGEYDKLNSNRPAKLYEFASKDVEYLDEDRINLDMYVSKE